MSGASCSCQLFLPRGGWAAIQLSASCLRKASVSLLPQARGLETISPKQVLTLECLWVNVFPTTGVSFYILASGHCLNLEKLIVNGYLFSSKNGVKLGALGIS
jgi:hypothetical protein